MSCLQRNICFASHCAISCLALAGCGPWTPTQPEDRAPRPTATPSEPACTNWSAYSEDWHRRHCNVAIRWCSVPSGSSPVPAAGTSGAAGAMGTYGTGSAGMLGAAGSGTGTGGDGEGSPRDGGLAVGDASASDASASMDSHAAPDSGRVATDASHATDGAGENSCVVGATCPQGTSCVMGSCQACAEGVCACQRDDDCAASQICDHDVGTCTTPPPACAALATEADCSARADCTPVYGGMSCTNTVGSPCHSGEANCTCATYSFAVCVARD
jgi:hypothetical protein